MKVANKPPAVACTLNAGGYQWRIQRFTELNREFLLKSLRLERGLKLTYSPQGAAELRDLVSLEQECCPFLHFELQACGTFIELSITVPESAIDSADELLEPFCSG